MNKKLIALAVAGACVAPAAMAQTANPVTLYGRVYLTIEQVEAKGGATSANDVSSRTRIVDQASYLGVRGTEDLGGGLKAWFQLETAFAPDDASAILAAPANTSPRTTGWASRNSGVGLMGSWGQIGAGRWDTPMKMSQTAVDPWGDLTMGDITGAALDQGNFSRRQDNSIQYWSPKWGGFDFKLMMTSNEGKNATGDPKAWGGSVTYAAGNLYVSYAYEEHKGGIAAQVGAFVPGFKEDGNTIAARYTMGKFRLSGHYGEYKKTGLAKEKSYFVGMDYSAGKHVFIGSFAQAAGGQTNGTAEPGCDMYSVGYRYDFSRRTFFIASYTEVNNDPTPAMNCTFGTGGGSGFHPSGTDPKGFGIGVRHVF